jgi:RND family efflux transporter MFP subunit
MMNQHSFRSVRTPALVAVLVALAAAAGCGGDAQQAAPQAPPVTVAQPETRDIRDYGIFTGSVRAVESADVVARVAGRLERVEYTVSSVVREGDVLFTIEKEKYQAARDAAFANLKSAEADLARAEAELVRVEKASRSRAVSEVDVDRAVADRDMARAAVLSAQAGLADAELSLSYCTVVAPIGGFAGRNQVDRGNLVGQSGPTLLTTINNLEQVYVYFNVPEPLLLKFLADNRESGMDPDEAKRDLPAAVSLANETDFPHEGRVDFIDNEVDARTGTIEMRAVLDNAAHFLFPGLFVRIKVPGAPIAGAVVIPETALGTDLGGKYVYVVGENNLVEQRYVELGLPQEGGTVHVREGLAGDETVIVNGLMFARPGLPVTPLTAEQFEAMLAQQAQGQG